MIDKLTYDEILEASRILKENSDIIDSLIENKNLNDLEDFVSTVEGYSKYLETVVEINKDADLALQFLVTQKKWTSKFMEVLLYIYLKLP